MLFACATSPDISASSIGPIERYRLLKIWRSILNWKQQSSPQHRARGVIINTSAARTRLPVAAGLSGGGARAAYQVGVFRAIAAMWPRGPPNPSPIFCGTSAGGITPATPAVTDDRVR